MRRIKLIAAMCLLLSPFAANAGPIAVDGGWYGFCFGGVGDTVFDGCQNQGVGTTGKTSTFSSANDMLLKVTDAFLYGDVFDVYVNNVLAFTTGAFSSGATTTDPDIAFDSGLYSSGSLLLAAGSYTVDILVNTSISSGGGAYIEVETATRVPESGALALLGIGLLGIGLSRRRRMS